MKEGHEVITGEKIRVVSWSHMQRSRGYAIVALDNKDIYLILQTCLDLFLRY